jgi:hypothetical protein
MNARIVAIGFPDDDVIAFFGDKLIVSYSSLQMEFPVRV